MRRDTRRSSAKAAELGLRAPPEPGLRDAFHLENRIASLCLDPANHPMPADSRLALALRGMWAIRRSRLPGRRRAVLAAWFLCVGMLPRTAAAHVAAWRLEPTSRPVAVDRLAPQLRCCIRARHSDEISPAATRSRDAALGYRRRRRECRCNRWE